MGIPSYRKHEMVKEKSTPKRAFFMVTRTRIELVLQP